MMYGGILNPNNKPIVPHSHSQFRHKIMIFFGSALYLFDKVTQQCLQCMTVGHQYDIISSYYDPDSQQLVSVDQGGMCFISKIKNMDNLKKYDKNTLIQNLSSFSILKTKSKKNKNQKDVNSQFIDDARISMLKGNLIIHYLHCSKLYKCEISTCSDKNNPVTINLNKQISPGAQFSKILFHRTGVELPSSNQDIQYAQQDVFIGVLSKSKKYIYLLNETVEKQAKYWEYTHHVQITAADVLLTDNQGTLIIGDKKGKIYLYNGYFSGELYTQTKLEWHTSPISSLCLNNNYLYSAGQESVVVLWHLRDFSRDFLPRIGTPITSLNVIPQTNQLVCFLTNNSLKIIDIASDKETYTFKLVLNPQGYYSSGVMPYERIISYNPNNQIICFASIAGRLQFINLNGPKCTQFQVFHRNLVNGLDQELPSPHEISSCCFNDNNRWDYMLISLTGKYQFSSLKFYRKKIGTQLQYELLTRIQNPHKGPVTNSFSLPNNKFLTFSQQDEQIKIWKQQKQKKKSIIESDLIFWKCQRVISYRNLKPKSVSCWQNYIAIAYPSFIIISSLEDSNSLQAKQKIRIYQYKDQNQIEKIKLLNKQLVIIVRKDQSVELWNWQNKNNKLPVLKWSLQTKSISEVKIFDNGINKASFIFQTQQMSRILLLDYKSMKITSSFTFQNSSTKPVKIWSAFWHHNSNLILILDNLTLQALNAKQTGQFVKYGGSTRNENYSDDFMMEEETMQAKSNITNYASQDIMNINQRWVSKKSAQSETKNINSMIENLHLMPSCELALSTAFKDLLF